MNVIAINAYKNDFPVAVVKIPEGKTANDTFILWYRLQNHSENETDEQILEEALYAWQELTVITIN